MDALPNTPAMPSAGTAPRIDFWTILDLLAHRWRWFALGAVLGGLALFLAAAKLVGPRFTASGQLLRIQAHGPDDLLKQDTPMSPDTFGGLIRAPDLLKRVGETVAPPIPSEMLAKQIKVAPAEESYL